MIDLRPASYLCPDPNPILNLQACTGRAICAAPRQTSIDPAFAAL